jgi:hypothetical protein
MSDTDCNSKETARSAGLRDHAPIIVALFAAAVIVVAWFWIKQQPQEAVLPSGLLAIGACTFVTAMIAYVREMDVADVLEMLGDVFSALLSVIGAILKGIRDWFLGLIGLD